MSYQFSENGKYFAGITADGKLKIWNTLTNTFEQEFTPDFHLASPCTCLHFIQTNSLKYKEGSPKKKKRRNSEPSENHQIAIGTTSGVLLLYSINKASLECTIESGANQTIHCLSTVDDNLIYSGADRNIIIWNLQKKKMLTTWKAGNEKISSVLAIPESNQLLTASKNIKLWDTQAKEVLRTFVGHKSEVTFLRYICPRPSGESYFLSGSKNDRVVSCWSLGDGASERNAIANFQLEDVLQSISISIDSDGATHMAATVRSGAVHIYWQTLNGKPGKPIKPKTTIQVVSDTGQSKEIVAPIKVLGAFYKDTETICLGYGSEVLLTFENIVIDANRKLQCLVREPSKNPTNQDQAGKVVKPVIDDKVQYLTSETSKVATTKRKVDGNVDVPMEKQLENLTLDQSDNAKALTAGSVAHLLVQGLHSKDKKILRTVLYQKDEDTVRNTVRRLPITALVPLIRELSNYVQGKTLSSQVGCLWLKHILQTHSGVLMSNPELPDLFGSCLGHIENRLSLFTPLSTLKGRLDLVLPQVSGTLKQDFSENDRPLLIYNDRDSSESEDEEDMQMDGQSESASEWEEESDIEQNHVNEKSESEGNESDASIAMST